MSLKELRDMDKTKSDLVKNAIMGSPVTVFFQSLDHQYDWIVNPLDGWSEDAVIGRVDDDLFDTENATLFQLAKAAARQSGDMQVVDVSAKSRPHERDRWFKMTIRLHKDKTGTETGFLCTCMEITDERERALTLKTLLREVSHRSKNMLSIVLSLAAQTARSSRDTEHFIRSFTGRVQSIAKSQDIVVASDWRGAMFGALVHKHVQSVVPIIEGQIHLTGDDVELSANGATHIGLALHELCTNSLSFGALSKPGGTVTISCTSMGRGGEYGAIISWREEGADAFLGDERGGFGRVLLERVVPAAVCGKGDLRYEQEQAAYDLHVGREDVLSAVPYADAANGNDGSTSAGDTRLIK